MQKKLKLCSGSFVRWSSQRKDGEKEIGIKTERLKKEQEVEGPHNIAMIKMMQEEFGVLLEKEDLKWKQRAKRNWYQHGDKNTKFFHACASQRKKKNWIKEIKNAQGQMLSEQQQVEKVFIQHFKSIFSSSRPSEEAIAACVRAIEPRVT